MVTHWATGSENAASGPGFEAVEEWVEAITGLLNDPERYGLAKQRIAEEREAFLWPWSSRSPTCSPAPCPSPPPKIVASLFEYAWAALAGTVRRRGLLGTAREVAGVLRRPDVP